MPRSLLITALAAMQLLSWSGSSFYLCLCGGAVCVDLGPDACRCRQSHGEDEFQGDEHGRHHGVCKLGDGCHDDGRRIQRTGDRGDCTHVRIAASAPMVVDGASWTHLIAGEPAFALATAIVSESCRLDHDFGNCPPSRIGGSSSWTALSSVVLRC